MSRVLSDFSAASGGALFPVMIGSGEVALERVLRETSAHYLLAVEPQEADRDGKLRELRVRVKAGRSDDSQPTCGSSSRSAACSPRPSG